MKFRQQFSDDLDELLKRLPPRHPGEEPELTEDDIKRQLIQILNKAKIVGEM